MPEDITSYSDDPRRLSAEELLGTLFSSISRPAEEILDIARQSEKHPGIDFFKLPVPYEIKNDSVVIRSGLSYSMRGAVSSIVADLETMPPEALVVVNIDATRIPEAQTRIR